jgi:threonine dehydrogenase-like Zn-dependent dehydrogenase
VHHANPRLGDTVAIFGLGVVGLLTMQLARIAGAHKLIVFDPLPKRREMALQLGANEALDPTAVDPGKAVRDRNDGRGADVAIECAASVIALQQSTRAVGPLGRVIMASMPNQAAPFHFGQEVHFNGIGIRGANVTQMPPEMGPLWSPDRRDTLCREFLGTLQLIPLITHEFPFEKAADAYALLDTNPKEVVSMVLRCPAAEKK